MAMDAHGVFHQALIKKRGQYWPKQVPGDDIEKEFKDATLILFVRSSRMIASLFTAVATLIM
jgi:hypothetical protein